MCVCVCVCWGGSFIGHRPPPTMRLIRQLLVGHCLATASPTHPQVTPQLTQRVLLHPTSRTPTHLCQDHDQIQVAPPSTCLCVLPYFPARSRPYKSSCQTGEIIPTLTITDHARHPNLQTSADTLRQDRDQRQVAHPIVACVFLL